MKRRKLLLFTIVVALGVIGITLCFVSTSNDLLSKPMLMEPSELVFTKAWDGEVVRLPGPLALPPWLKKTKEYRRILQRGSVSDLTWLDVEGNTYVAHAFGREENQGGEPFVSFSSVQKRRPDGSLDNVTRLGGENQTLEWSIMDERGNRLMLGSKKNDGRLSVAFFDADEDKLVKVKEWEIDSKLNIQSEQVRDEGGRYHFTYR